MTQKVFSYVVPMALFWSIWMSTVPTPAFNLSDIYLLDYGQETWFVDPAAPTVLEMTFCYKPPDFTVCIYDSDKEFQSPDDTLSHYSFYWSSDENVFHEIGPSQTGTHLVPDLCDYQSNETTTIISLGLKLDELARIGQWEVTIKTEALDPNPIFLFSVTSYLEISTALGELLFEGRPGETVTGKPSPFGVQYTSNCQIDLLFSTSEFTAFSRFLMDDDPNVDELIETGQSQREISLNVTILKECPAGFSMVKDLYFFAQFTKTLPDQNFNHALNVFATPSYSSEEDETPPIIDTIIALDPRGEMYINTEDRIITLKAMIQDDVNISKTIFGVDIGLGKVIQLITPLPLSHEVRKNFSISLGSTGSLNFFCRTWDVKGNQHTRSIKIPVYPGPAPSPGIGPDNKYLGVAIWSTSGFSGMDWWPQLMSTLRPAVVYMHDEGALFLTAQKYKRDSIKTWLINAATNAHRDGVWIMWRISNAKNGSVGIGPEYQDFLDEILSESEHPPLWVTFGTEWGDPGPWNQIIGNLQACDAIVRGHGGKGFRIQPIVGKEWLYEENVPGISQWIIGGHTNFPHFDGSMPESYNRTVRLSKDKGNPNNFLKTIGYVADNIENKWSSEVVHQIAIYVDDPESTGYGVPCLIILNRVQNMLDDTDFVNAVVTQAEVREWYMHV